MARKLFSGIFFIVVFLALTMLFSIFIFPGPEKEYVGFWHGLLGYFHGLWILANWVIGFFNEARLLKAVTHGSWYGFFWWAGIISFVIMFILNVIVPLFVSDDD